jgi:hypothetical protein
VKWSLLAGLEIAEWVAFLVLVPRLSRLVAWIERLSPADAPAVDSASTHPQVEREAVA